jgi:ribosomal protein S27AE
VSEIVSLEERKKAKKLVYCFTCSCGNQVFVLRPDARIECGHCGDIQTQLLWGQYFVSPSAGIDATPIPLSDPP